MVRDHRVVAGVACVQQLAGVDVDAEQDSLHVVVGFDVHLRVGGHVVASCEVRAPLENLLQTHGQTNYAPQTPASAAVPGRCTPTRTPSGAITTHSMLARNARSAAVLLNTGSSMIVGDPTSRSCSQPGR